jgi:hypothetical protein
MRFSLFTGRADMRVARRPVAFHSMNSFVIQYEMSYRQGNCLEYFVESIK